MNQELAFEQAVKAAGCEAPRLTPEDIDAVIVSETYTMLPSGKCMVCEITLANGHVVIGESYAVSKENFREVLGKEASYNNARNKVWAVEGYLLQQRLWEKKYAPE